MTANSMTTSWIAFAPVRTFTPFLYQTRTLSTTRQVQKRVLQLPQPALAHSQRFLHDSNIPITRVAVSLKPKRPVYKSLSINNRDVEREEKPGLDNIPWEGRSGMEDTDEEQRFFATRIKRLSSSEEEGLEDLRYSVSSEPFADEDNLNENQEEMATYTAPTAPALRESTITATEREAFERIFADIMARSKSVGTYSTLPSSHSNNEAPVLTDQFARGRNARNSARVIMNGASDSISDHQSKFVKGGSRNRSPVELRAHVDEYPLPLRAAAAKALGLVSGRSTDSLEENIASNVDELEIARQPERERVESLMRCAKTDIELWQVMENEVFALVGKLGLQEKPKVQAGNIKTRPQRRTKDVSKTVGVKTPVSAISDTPLDLNIYGPLYPSHVLLGLRLLDRSFANPSALVLNLLPRIKSLGIVSHVLGASTAFYNELLRIYWTRYDDFIGVLDLLKEMEQAGLEFDEDSLNIVNEIHQAQLRVRRGDQGSVLQALWSLPEFAPGKFKSWKEKIQSSIDEKTMEVGDEVTWAT